MAQFDIYENGEQHSRHTEPYILDVQSDLLAGLATRLVIPLIPKEYIEQPVDILNPVIRVAQQNYYLSTPQLRSVRKTQLGRKVANIAQRQEEIRACMDFLLRGNCDYKVI
jgi:toxin CcdB